MMADSGKKDDDISTKSVGSRSSDRTHGYMNAERRNRRDEDDGSDDDIEESDDGDDDDIDDDDDDDEASISLYTQPDWSWDIDSTADCQYEDSKGGERTATMEWDDENKVNLTIQDTSTIDITTTERNDANEVACTIRHTSADNNTVKRNDDAEYNDTNEVNNSKQYTTTDNTIAEQNEANEVDSTKRDTTTDNIIAERNDADELDTTKRHTTSNITFTERNDADEVDCTKRSITTSITTTERNEDNDDDNIKSHSTTHNTTAEQNDVHEMDNSKALTTSNNITTERNDTDELETSIRETSTNYNATERKLAEEVDDTNRLTSTSKTSEGQKHADEATMADSGKEDHDTFTESLDSRSIDRTHGYMNTERRTGSDDDDDDDDDEDVEESDVDEDEASISIYTQPEWSWDIDSTADSLNEEYYLKEKTTTDNTIAEQNAANEVDRTEQDITTDNIITERNDGELFDSTKRHTTSDITITERNHADEVDYTNRYNTTNNSTMERNNDNDSDSTVQHTTRNNTIVERNDPDASTFYNNAATERLITNATDTTVRQYDEWVNDVTTPKTETMKHDDDTTLSDQESMKHDHDTEYSDYWTDHDTETTTDNAESTEEDINDDTEHSDYWADHDTDTTTVNAESTEEDINDKDSISPSRCNHNEHGKDFFSDEESCGNIVDLETMQATSTKNDYPELDDRISINDTISTYNNDKAVQDRIRMNMNNVGDNRDTHSIDKTKEIDNALVCEAHRLAGKYDVEYDEMRGHNNASICVNISMKNGTSKEESGINDRGGKSETREHDMEMREDSGVMASIPEHPSMTMDLSERKVSSGFGSQEEDNRLEENTGTSIAMEQLDVNEQSAATTNQAENHAHQALFDVHMLRNVIDSASDEKDLDLRLADYFQHSSGIHEDSHCLGGLFTMEEEEEEEDNTVESVSQTGTKEDSYFKFDGWDEGYSTADTGEDEKFGDNGLFDDSDSSSISAEKDEVLLTESMMDCDFFRLNIDLKESDYTNFDTDEIFTDRFKST